MGVETPSPSGIPYTLERFLKQQAIVERNHTEVDDYGAEVSKNFEALATYRCRFSWWEDSASGRGLATEGATAQRTVDMNGGTLILAPGTEVRPGDRVTRILNAGGSEEIPGPFRITTLVNYLSHIELGLERP